MIVERIARPGIGDIVERGFFFSQADRGNLRFGEDDVGKQAVIHFSHVLGMCDVVSRHFSLLNRNMNYFVRPGAIAHGIDVRNISLHVSIRENRSQRRSHARVFQVEPCDIGDAAQSEENLFRLRCADLAVPLKCDLLRFRPA